MAFRRALFRSPAAKPWVKFQHIKLSATIEDIAIHISRMPQQKTVLAHLVRGRLNKQIAHDLGVSMTTIKAHVSAILQKLGVLSRTQAVIKANQEIGSAGGGERGGEYR